MSKSPAPAKSQPSLRKVCLWLVILLLGSALTAGVFTLYSKNQGSAAYLQNLEKAAGARESAARAELSVRLAAADASNGARTVSAELGAALFQNVAAHFVGLSMEFDAPRLGPVAVQVEKVDVEFRDGFPRLRGELAVTAQGRTIKAKTLVVLEPQLLPGHVELKVQCLGIAPTGPSLPAWAAQIANAEATAAANRELEKHPITLPLRETVDFSFPPPAPIDTEIKTPNGKVFVRITLPAGQAVRRWVQPQAVFFTSDGLHLLATLSETAPQLAAPVPASAGAPAGDALARWRLAPGESVRVRVGREPILSLLSVINTWPDASRTVQFQGLREEGHILERTGGAPFGNGFSAGLDDPKRLQGKVVLQKFAPTWEAEKQQISLAVTAAAEGSVQVHFHGHPPHIDPPRIFGIRIGGGVTLGGGAGTSIGASVPRQDSTVTAAAVLNPATQVLEVRLLEPAELPFKLDIGGVPDELEKLFKLGFKVPLPRDRALYQIALPAVIANTVMIPLPKQAGGGQKAIKLKVEAKSRLDGDGLQFSGTIEVAAP